MKYYRDVFEHKIQFMCACCTDTLSGCGWMVHTICNQQTKNKLYETGKKCTATELKRKENHKQNKNKRTLVLFKLLISGWKIFLPPTKLIAFWKRRRLLSVHRKCVSAAGADDDAVLCLCVLVMNAPGICASRPMCLRCYCIFATGNGFIVS